MGSRERKRAERQKRKRRAAQRVAPQAGDPGPGENSTPATEPVGSEENFQERMSRRSDERNAEARATLKPLAPDERPTAVTIGAIVSAAIAVIFTGSAVVAIFSEAEIQGEEPNPFPLAVFALALWMMAWGMWKARYWAVLGFQMLLVLVLLATTLGLVGATEISVLQVVGSLLLIAGLGTLFYFLIRAMARIQMPERPGER